MAVRRATPDDIAVLERLWREFELEVPPPGHADHDPERELGEIAEIVGAGLGFLAEEDDVPVGFALARRTGSRLGRLTDLYVVPDARRGGLAAALVHAVVEELAAQGVEHLDLEVKAASTGARAVYHRWGFGEDVVVLVAPVASLRERLAPGRHAESFASIHVQTDAVGDVERAVRAFAPRIGSNESAVVGPRNGWVAVYDEVVDEDPTALVRFARELSSRMGAVVIAISLEVDEVVRMVALDRGGIVDEYLSVPEFYGPLAPGDVIGMAANPTVLARLTGAEPQLVREAAPTAASPADLPPAREILASLAAALGLDGALHGHAGSARTPHGSLDPVLTLYDAPRCPYCARTRIVLAEKGVPYETVTIDLANRPAWLLEHNPPDGRVPVLEDDGWVLPESSVIDEYLEERYPEPPLLPADPGERAAARLFVFRFDDFKGPYYALRRGEAGAAEQLADALSDLDRTLATMPFLTGRSFGLADLSYLPWLLRLRDLMGISLDPYPALTGWLRRCCERPSVAAEVETIASLAA